MRTLRCASFEPRIDVPQHTRTLLFAFKRCCPLLAEANLVEPVARRERRHKDRGRYQSRRPRLFLNHAPDDSVYVGGDPPIAAVAAVDAAASGAQPNEELLDGSRAYDFRVGLADTGDGVRVAAGDGYLAELCGEPRSAGIGLPPHLTVTGLESRDIRGKPGEIFHLAAAGESGKDVVDAEEDLALGQVHEQRDEVFAPALNLAVVTLADGIDTHMEFAAAWHLHGDFLADEEVGVTAERLGHFDRVMVGDGDHRHAEALEPAVEFCRVVVGLSSKPG